MKSFHSPSKSVLSTGTKPGKVKKNRVSSVLSLTELVSIKARQKRLAFLRKQPGLLRSYFEALRSSFEALRICVPDFKEKIPDFKNNQLALKLNLV